VYKKLAYPLVYLLSILFNLIFQLGNVPLVWKEAIVCPIFKKAASSKPSNYRPISLTNSCCKLFESVILNNLLSFLEANKIISSAQHRFLKRHSTSTNLLESLNDWTGALNKSQEVLILYVDFFRAFDSVSVPNLLYKLRCIGIGGSLLDIIASLLSSRTQRVRVNGNVSDSRLVMSRVQQGSILGPILFILFINDLHANLPSSTMSKLFADDFKSYLVCNSDNHCIDDFNDLISAIERWSDIWQLPLSIEKCSWMLLSNKLTRRKLDFFYP